MKNRANHQIGTYLNFAEPDTEREIRGKRYKAGETVELQTRIYGKITVLLKGFRDNSAIVVLPNKHKTVISYREFPSLDGKRKARKKRRSSKVPVNGDYVREHIERMGMLQSEAAKKIGKSDSYISRVVSDDTVALKTIPLLVDILGMDEEKLLELPDTEKLPTYVLFDGNKLKEAWLKKEPLSTLGEVVGRQTSAGYRITNEERTSRVHWEKITKHLGVPFDTFLKQH